jgi:hypothetical protein
MLSSYDLLWGELMVFDSRVVTFFYILVKLRELDGTA